jgi:hypothetical protein
MNEPMHTLLGEAGDTHIANEILEGNIPVNLDPNMEAILREMKQKRPDMSPYIPYHQMVKGFQKWRESTTTSPSNKHLGIYKTLVQFKKSTTLPQPKTKHHQLQSQDYMQQLATYQTLASKALTIQNMIMNLAIRQAHVLNRWKKIHNFFLEKIPGKPLLEKLRVIHIYEADWNLLLKYFTAYKLNLTACQQQTVSPAQNGGRQGKSAGTTADQITVTTETINLQRLNGAMLYNDAKAYFDRIIENICNLILRSEGLHQQIINYMQQH